MLLPPTAGGAGQKSVAVPLMTTVCGLLAVLSVKIRFAFFAPVVEPHCAPEAGAGGLNVICIVQVPPAGTAVQLFLGVKSAVSLTLTLLTVNAPWPVLVSIIGTGVLGTPTS